MVSPISKSGQDVWGVWMSVDEGKPTANSGAFRQAAHPPRPSEDGSHADHCETTSCKAMLLRCANVGKVLYITPNGSTLRFKPLILLRVQFCPLAVAKTCIVPKLLVEVLYSRQTDRH